jgi:hypothetical protein
MGTVWIRGKVARCQHDNQPLDPDEPKWELIGVFESHALASEDCRDCRYFVAPLPMNRSTEGENPPHMEWPSHCRHFAKPVAAPSH